MLLFSTLFVTIVTAFTVMAAMTNLLLYPIKVRYRIIIFIMLIMIQMLFINYGQLISILCIGGVLIIISIFSTNRISNITFATFGYMLQVFINHLMNIPLSMAGITVQKISSIPLFSILFVTLFSAVTFAATYSLGRYLRNILPEYMEYFPHSIQILFMIEVLACTIVFIMNIIRGGIYGFTQSMIFYNGIIFGVFFLLTFVIFILCLYIMKKNSELERIQKDDENLLEYMDKLEGMYEEMRIFKHDYLNILSTLNHYIMDEDMESLKSYFQSQIMPDSVDFSGKGSILSKLSNIKIRELKGLIYSKLVIALNLQLSVTLEIRNEISQVTMNTLDLCKVLGIFLDNALDAAKQYGAGEIILAIMDNENHITTIISNSSVTEKINVQKIYAKSYTTKADHSGIGLYSAKTIIDRYPNVTHSTQARNFMFTQTLHIYKE